MNWGTKLIIAMGLFIGFIITLGIIMVNSKTDALVETDYYEKGINYDTDFAKKQQVINDHAAPTIQVGKTLSIQFIHQPKGTLQFLRPDNKKQDFKLDLEADSNHLVTIAAAAIKSGRWHLILNWENAGKKYLFEQEINLP
ncbi:MAG: FixH family protein [Sphingobacteriaceae bacterium]